MNKHYFDFIRCSCNPCSQMRRNPVYAVLDFVRKERLLSWRRKEVIERKKKKVFILGQNKTGTTSLERYLRNADYILGDQRRFELETEHALMGRFKQVEKLIDAGEAFQDVPFSKANEAFLDFLTSKYPNARFILNTRDRLDWYNSCDRFYRKIWFHHDRDITWEDLDGVNYHGGSVVLRKHRVNQTQFQPFEKEPFLDSFDTQNSKVEAYFSSRPYLKFLKTDVTRRDFDLEELATFLEIKEPVEFPRMNKSK